jgi:hypothetical protein
MEDCEYCGQACWTVTLGVECSLGDGSLKNWSGLAGGTISSATGDPSKRWRFLIAVQMRTSLVKLGYRVDGWKFCTSAALCSCSRLRRTSSGHITCLSSCSKRSLTWRSWMTRRVLVILHP